MIIPVAHSAATAEPTIQAVEISPGFIDKEEIKPAYFSGVR